MVNQTNLLTLLAAPTIGNAPLTGNIANLGDSTFQNYMKDAVRESSTAKESDSSSKNERADRASYTETHRPKEHPDNRPTDESVRPQAHKASDSNDQKRTPVDNATEHKQVSADPQKQPNETIDSLEPIESQVYADINALLQTLAKQLNLNPDDLIVDATADPLAQQQKLLSLLPKSRRSGFGTFSQSGFDGTGS